ncbi:C4-dicarboxylate ABC transporter [Bordetella genomosp. 5]|uniref:C4-dicarboxylate ABC transporter n=1 Tax=Bordetella genomosp. 5 TaxID=1395608 RepID=A0A261TZL2_9BORD|nr:tripartite tricarboxylate transporter substrate binding protein [Bordetella genomosp. 5]OZI45470.1 C4-dicarboxylate ABC transporter [Bordetella genomosp. 5]OZI54612.1 C4-dicarboxylate ABC transporter [Bordetella genomosp. 5]
MLRSLSTAALILTTAFGATAQAEDPAKWPTRAITIVGGFPGGAGTDLYARKMGEALSKELGVAIIADNRTGAGGNVASDIVARAPADGYTFLLGTAGTHAINAALYKSLSFDVQKDFTHIALLGDVPNVLLVNPKKHPDIKTCGDLIKLAESKPSALNYASTGNGASGHLAGAQFTNGAKIKVTHVPYRGQGPAMTALLSGEVDFFFNQSAPSVPAVKSGQVVALGVTTAERIKALPDVPTIAEACNIKGYESSTWYGLFAPAKLPPEIQKRMSEAVIKVISTPEFKTWLTDTQGILPPADPSIAAFQRVHQADIKRWAEVVKLSGATVD